MAPPRRNNRGRALPSNGGRGIRLKTPRRRFREKPRLNNTAAKWGRPDCTETTVSENKPVSPGTKRPAANPSLRPIQQVNEIRKFAAGPAMAITAARRGYWAAHAGLYGALAQPIIQPAVR